jgi:hypothetical protein
MCPYNEGSTFHTEVHEIGNATGLFTGEQHDRAEKPETAGYYVDQITAEWRKTVDGMLAAAKHCARAQKRLSPAERKELIERLPFERPTFDKLVKIGNDPRLHDPEVSARLPAGYSVVYELANLYQHQFEDALGKGLIHPKLKRAEAQALKDSGSPAPTKSKSKPLLAFTAGLDRRGSETLLDWDRQALANLRTAWDSNPALVAVWEAASAQVRNAFVREVLGVTSSAAPIAEEPLEPGCDSAA